MTSRPIAKYCEEHGIPLDVGYCAADALRVGLTTPPGYVLTAWQVWGLQRVPDPVCIDLTVILREAGHGRL